MLETSNSLASLDEDEYFICRQPLSLLVISFRRENRAWKKYKFYSTGGDIMYSKDKYIERT